MAQELTACTDLGNVESHWRRQVRPKGQTLPETVDLTPKALEEGDMLVTRGYSGSGDSWGEVIISFVREDWLRKRVRG